MENIKVIARSKDSGSTKSLLKKGMVPGIIYGKNSEPSQIVFEDKALQKLMHSGVFYSKIINLDVEGKKEKVLPKQLQYHPVTDKLIHFDFLRVQDDTKVTVEIEVEFLNRDICPGLKQGGVLRGISSWYGPNFHGKLTANGEVFDQYGVTAAHKTLPLGTVVRVTNLDNEKSVILRMLKGENCEYESSKLTKREWNKLMDSFGFKEKMI